MGLDPTSVKRALRKSIIARRDALHEAKRRAMSAVITRKITGLCAYREAQSVLAYMNFGSEFDTGEFVINVLQAGKTLILPRLNAERSGLDLYRVTDLEIELEIGVWGIREPRSGCALIRDFDRIDFILVPGVAFSQDGGRLGYGGGFYDRLLVNKRANALALAAAFSAQMVEAVPLDANDIAVDLIVTETGEYGCLNRKKL